MEEIAFAWGGILTEGWRKGISHTRKRMCGSTEPGNACGVCGE